MMNITNFAQTWKPRILLAVLLAAGVLSYAALYETSRAAGYSVFLAWGWPLLIDGVVLFAVISLAERQTRGLSTGFVWFVLIVFDAASITLNAAYGLEISWQAALVHSLPAAVAPLMLKLFTNDIKDAEAAKRAADEAAKLARSQHRSAAKRAANGEKSALRNGNAAAPIEAANAAKSEKIEARRSQIITLKAADPDLSPAQLAEIVGASADTIRRDLRALNGQVNGNGNGGNHD
jgi:hypothetical protein